MFKFFLLFFLCFPFGADAQNCPLGQHWVRAFFRHEYYRSDGAFVRSSNVTAHCQTNPAGYDFWQPKIENGRPAGWPHTSEVTKNWTDEEIEKVLDALADL